MLRELLLTSSEQAGSLSEHLGSPPALERLLDEIAGSQEILQQLGLALSDAVTLPVEDPEVA